MERLGEAGEFVNTLFTANLDAMLGDDRRFGLYVITHPDAAGVIVRVGGTTGGPYARQWFPERGESPADFTPDRCIDLIRTAVGDPAVDVRLLTRMPFTMTAEAGDHLPRGERLPGRRRGPSDDAGRRAGDEHGDPVGAQPGLEAGLGGPRMGRRGAAGQLPRRAQTRG